MQKEARERRKKSLLLPHGHLGGQTHHSAQEVHIQVLDQHCKVLHA